MCDLSDYLGMELDEAHRHLLEIELPIWHQHYLPPGGVAGKNVIDGGGGCGETAQFYLLHGAKKVLTIEADPAKAAMIRRNFKNDPRVIVQEFFIDFMKWDVEGAEKDMVVETHFIPHLDNVLPYYIPYLHRYRMVGRGAGGPAELYALRSYARLSRVMGWVHMKRIRAAHLVRSIVNSV